MGVKEQITEVTSQSSHQLNNWYESIGVDLNRNFPQDFENGQKNPEEETYSGPYPLSEPASQCVDSRLKETHHHIYLDIHTGEFTMFYDKNTDIYILNTLQKKVMKNVKKNYCKQCLIKPDEDIPTTFKYAQRKYGSQFASVIEVFGGFMSSEVVDDINFCYTMFSPLTVNQKQFYTNRWVRALSTILLEVEKELPRILNYKAKKGNSTVVDRRVKRKI